MRCDLIREALSARLDDEAMPVPEQTVQRHLSACVRCRDWQRAATDLHRRARLTAAPAATDLTERVLAAIPTAPPARPRRTLTAARVMLGVVALLQLAMSSPVLVLGHDHAAPVHVAHELGSFDAALAIGLLLAAFRPRLARGMLPLVGVIAALLLLTAGSDLAAGRTAAVDEIPHLCALTGFVLLAHLATPTSRRERAGRRWRSA